ncbi:unnamed protein product [Toxocara canis]|uniref:Uncharacterized protein n=1 Tax=Toxocara canis TaxID=6265 RepID=A0A183U1D0_TOXCA|nr:unnamed protein product [Toxocara canis]
MRDLTMHVVSVEYCGINSEYLALIDLLFSASNVRPQRQGIKSTRALIKVTKAGATSSRMLFRHGKNPLDSSERGTAPHRRESAERDCEKRKAEDPSVSITRRAQGAA